MSSMLPNKFVSSIHIVLTLLQPAEFRFLQDGLENATRIPKCNICIPKFKIVCNDYVNYQILNYYYFTVGFYRLLIAFNRQKNYHN